MAERIEEPEAEVSATSEQVSPAAVAIALGRMSKATKAIDDKAAAFLDEQTGLLRLQKEHLHEQRELMLSRLRWGRFSDRIKAALQVMTACVGLAVVSVIGAMAWQAHEDRGLTIAAFSVPPDLAARGLTGEVVASRVLDRLSELQNQTAATARPASTYAKDWGEDIKVEIPETGVSIGELNRYLRQWLGHETRITGEVVRTAGGLSVTARAGAEPGKTFPGPEADIDALIGQAAEAAYALSQPYRYAVYLASHGRAAEGLALYEQLALHGLPEDQPWAYGGWSGVLMTLGDYEGVVRVVGEGQRRGLPLYESGALNNLGIAQNELSRNAAMLVTSRQVLDAVRRTGRGFAGLSREAAERNMQAVIAVHLGDSQSENNLWRQAQDLDVEGRQGAVTIAPLLAYGLIADHDVTAGLRLSAPTTSAGYTPGANRMRAAAMLEDWREAVAAGEKEYAAETTNPAQRQVGVRGIAASLAIAYAHVGRLADAHALIAKTPLDCDACVDARAQIADLAGDRAGADRWFDRLERTGPDLPLPDTDWGAALLARGNLDGAIAKLKAAHGKGPHFADPLVLWGEALMRKGDLQGAIAKFAEADQYAPRWGRNHILWGEALMLSGRYAGARAQYETANGLDLSKADRAALNVLLARTAAGPLHG